MTAVSTRRHEARGRWRGSSSTWGSQTKESCRRPWRFNLRKAVGSAQTVRQREALLDRAECYCQIL